MNFHMVVFCQLAECSISGYQDGPLFNCQNKRSQIHLGGFSMLLGQVSYPRYLF
ncbi:hypothetical protein Rmar_2813 (plasmid) [Rhodothermus marinus DSM 4252]|uniref:Uncharacterized protein n=1 Tax=Rhodothermus marinus (strain ATCC 43812 / DSM 4252 / R-10) TaxID=518766 RepID=D0MKL7_RHOM4|nr:hypothetical protein Rmar_2813 [Rhodothermus marinus DSM 4252]